MDLAFEWSLEGGVESDEWAVSMALQGSVSEDTEAPVGSV